MLCVLCLPFYGFVPRRVPRWIRFSFLFEILSRGESEVELQSKERTLPLNLALLTRLGRTGYRKRKTFSFLQKTDCENKVAMLPEIFPGLHLGFRSLV